MPLPTEALASLQRRYDASKAEAKRQTDLARLYRAALLVIATSGCEGGEPDVYCHLDDVPRVDWCLPCIAGDALEAARTGSTHGEEG